MEFRTPEKYSKKGAVLTLATSVLLVICCCWALNMQNSIMASIKAAKSSSAKIQEWIVVIPDHAGVVSQSWDIMMRFT